MIYVLAGINNLLQAVVYVNLPFENWILGQQEMASVRKYYVLSNIFRNMYFVKLHISGLSNVICAFLSAGVR